MNSSQTPPGDDGGNGNGSSGVNCREQHRSDVR